MEIQKIHHIAFRCHSARQTADFYKRVLNMELLGAVSDDVVPSTRDPHPYVSILLDAGSGGIVAFFEVADFSPMQPDPNTPQWVQHIAFQVGEMNELLEAKQRAEAEGLSVIGPIDHSIFQSIYFFDPDGHRVEVAVPTITDDHMRRLKSSAEDVLAQWAKTKRASSEAAWLHQPEFNKTTKVSND